MAKEIDQDYLTYYHTYPIYSCENGFEGASKRFVASPTPTDLINFALKGLPKVYPLTGERIAVEDVEYYLTSAFVETETSMNMDITPTEHYQSCDYVPDMFGANWSGVKLSRFPATQILSVKLKFPHTQTVDPIIEYVIPASWLILRNGRMNISASFGNVVVSQGGDSQGYSGIGMFSFMAGFARGQYQPAVLQIQYISGWQLDKMPAIVADLVLTVAAIRMLNDLGPVLFPFRSTSVSIDAVSQSAQLPGPQLLLGRIQALEIKRKQLENAIMSNLGKNIKMAFIGS